jgi:hypothetical protein
MLVRCQSYCARSTRNEIDQMKEKYLNGTNIDERNKQYSKALLRTIQLSKNEFTIILACCNYTALREQLVRGLKTSSIYKIDEVFLEKSEISLYAGIASKLGDSKPNSLMVFGLESVYDLDKVLTSANNIREEFRNDFPFPIILWVNSIVIKKLMQVAPDFESWTTAFSFNFPDNQLIYILQEFTENSFRLALETGAHQTVSKSAVLDSHRSFELRSARSDLSIRSVNIEPELEAKLDFVQGLDAYIRNQIEEAKDYFKKSLAFWESSYSLKRQACLYYYVGLCWRRDAYRNSSGNIERYKSDCNKAEQCFRQCINILEEQDNRPDLAAKFINALGEVLQRQDKWVQLGILARKAIRLHSESGDKIRLSYAYGLLAAVTLKDLNEPNYLDAKTVAEKALKELRLTRMNMPES